jgi:hypothetical protein
MKRNGTFLIMYIAAHACLAQMTAQTLGASLTSDRMVIAKNSLTIPAWHEKTFWPVYEDYVNNIANYSSSVNRTSSDFATAEFDHADNNAYEQGQKMLAARFDVLTVRQRYYSSIGASFNGIIALQFIQTEALFDMMETSALYENSRWKNFKFHPNITNAAKVKAAKHNMINAALNIPQQQAHAFWNVYNQYEEECDALLGDNYNMISLYSSEPSDFTPALAKRLGSDFMNVMERELKLKQKYFDQMNLFVGPTLAAGFLAWEDYYSVVSKMHAWAEN